MPPSRAAHLPALKYQSEAVAAIEITEAARVGGFMRRQVESLALIVALAAALAFDPAATPAAADQPSAKSAPALGTHSVQGVVTSVDASTLVIARSGRRHTN